MTEEERDQFSVRVPKSLFDRAKAIAQARGLPGAVVNRNDVINFALVQLVAADDAAKTKPATRAATGRPALPPSAVARKAMTR